VATLNNALWRIALSRWSTADGAAAPVPPPHGAKSFAKADRGSL
jgi:hypothetical protein